MSLKYVIDELVAVPGPLRDHYAQAEDGKFHLVLDGHPDAAKIKEFRQSNIDLTKKLADFGDLDPVAAKAAIAKLAAGAGDAEDVVALKLALATEQSKVAAAQAEATALAHRHAVSAAFLAAGGQPSAVDLIVLKAPADTDKLDEWLKDAAVSEELGYTFKASKGGSAGGAKPVRLGAGNPNVLRNPSPQDLGKYASDIKSGKMKVEYTT